MSPSTWGGDTWGREHLPRDRPRAQGPGRELGLRGEGAVLSQPHLRGGGHPQPSQAAQSDPQESHSECPLPSSGCYAEGKGIGHSQGPLLSGSKPTQDLPPFRAGLPPAQLLHRAGGPTQASTPPCPRPLQTPDPHTPDLAPGPRLETGSVRTLPPLPASATWASGPLCTRSYPPPPPVATLSPSEPTPEAATTGGLPQPSTRHT